MTLQRSPQHARENERTFEHPPRLPSCHRVGTPPPHGASLARPSNTRCPRAASVNAHTHPHRNTLSRHPDSAHDPHRRQPHLGGGFPPRPPRREHRHPHAYVPTRHPRAPAFRAPRVAPAPRRVRSRLVVAKSVPGSHPRARRPAGIPRCAWGAGGGGRRKRLLSWTHDKVVVEVLCVCV